MEKEKKKKVIAIQNVDPSLWDRVTWFLGEYRRIPSISQLARVSLETYMDLATKYGIDADWKIKLPPSPPQAGPERVDK